MYKIVILLIAFLPAMLKAQQVENIRVSQEGDKVKILFDLTGQPSLKYNINVSVSSDNGRAFNIVPKTITGDINNVTPGNNKQIHWDVLKDSEQLTGDGFVFKISVRGISDFGIEMITVQGGTFQMGSATGHDDEKPVHSVTLSAFQIGKTEVTQAQWEAVMGASTTLSNPSDIKGANLPVEHVSWNDIQTFITKLNQLTGGNYRLPTEAEWEYAARGGKSSNGYTYAGSNTIGNVAWYRDNSGSTTRTVATKTANELGLYDMSGNVYEWCSDWYGDYSSASQTNPTGPFTGSGRVFRGGSWTDYANNCRVATRRNIYPGHFGDYFGFRLARNL